MSSINTSEWKEFKIGDLFEIKPTKNYGMSNNSLFESEGNVPVIVNSAINNGVGGYVGLEPTEEGNCITFSDTTDANSIFYQPVPFVGYSHVQCMRPLNDDLPENIMRFIASVFKSAALSYNFDYSNKFRRDIALEMHIKLPAKSDVEPDWEYMEKYMKDIEEEVVNKISKLESTNKIQKQDVDTISWKEFRLGDLFNLERPNARVSSKYSEGNMPFIASGMNNNGISKYVEPLSENDFDKGQCLTVSPLDGSCFWQPDDFLGRGGSGASIVILRSNFLNEKIGLFIASCIRKKLQNIAGYSNLYTGAKLLNVKIKLPAKSDTEPDWEYMETYVAELMKKAESNVDKFKDIVEK